MVKKNEMLLADINECIINLFSTERMLKGSLYKISKKCGTKYCKKCAKGEYHEVYQFTYKNKKNILTSTTIKKNEYKNVNRLWQNYKNFRKHEDELKKKMQELINQIKSVKDSNQIFINDFKKSLNS